MRGRLLHTINSLALSVTCGDTLSLLSLRDIFPRPGEVFPQRGGALGKTANFVWTAKASHFGRGGIA